jgi:hypothetical protein
VFEYPHQILRVPLHIPGQYTMPRLRFDTLVPQYGRELAPRIRLLHTLLSVRLAESVSSIVSILATRTTATPVLALVFQITDGIDVTQLFVCIILLFELLGLLVCGGWEVVLDTAHTNGWYLETSVSVLQYE